MCHFDRLGIIEIINFKVIFFTFTFLNIDISVNLYVINLDFSKYILKVVLERSMSQMFHLGPSF